MPTQWRILWTAAAALALSSCDRSSSPSYSYQSVTGRVTECHPETGDLTLSPERGSPLPPQTLLCVVTSDSEIYINDRLSGIEEVRPGDRIEIVGYRESNASAGQLVISYARIHRPAPPLPPPAIVGTSESGATAAP